MAKTTNPNHIPGFQTENPSEIRYQHTNMRNQATVEAQHSEYGQVVRKATKRSQRLRLIRKVDPIVQKSTQIASNAKSRITHEIDAYCIQGDCGKSVFHSEFQILTKQFQICQAQQQPVKIFVRDGSLMVTTKIVARMW